MTWRDDNYQPAWASPFISRAPRKASIQSRCCRAGVAHRGCSLDTWIAAWRVDTTLILIASVRESFRHGYGHDHRHRRLGVASIGKSLGGRRRLRDRSKVCSSVRWVHRETDLVRRVQFLSPAPRSWLSLLSERSHNAIRLACKW